MAPAWTVRPPRVVGAGEFRSASLAWTASDAKVLFPRRRVVQFTYASLRPGRSGRGPHPSVGFPRAAPSRERCSFAGFFASSDGRPAAGSSRDCYGGDVGDSACRSAEDARETSDVAGTVEDAVRRRGHSRERLPLASVHRPGLPNSPSRTPGGTGRGFRGNAAVALWGA